MSAASHRVPLTVKSSVSTLHRQIVADLESVGTPIEELEGSELNFYKMKLWHDKRAQANTYVYTALACDQCGGALADTCVHAQQRYANELSDEAAKRRLAEIVDQVNLIRRQKIDRAHRRFDPSNFNTYGEHVSECDANSCPRACEHVAAAREEKTE